MINIKYKIGDIVTIKSHPMAYQPNGEIDSYIGHIPPLMCVKEIHVEKTKEKYSKEFKKHQVAEEVKYVCTYFNQQKSNFENKHIYQEVLISFENLIFFRKNELDEGNRVKLIDETLEYTTANYAYGETVYFKTYKLEKRKSSKKLGVNVKNNKLITHTSPAFILCGITQNDNENIYDSKNGELRRKGSDILYKVLWYNSYQEKFSEEYLPKEFFTNDSRIFNNTRNSNTNNSKNTLPTTQNEK